ncbi:undecaprenyl-diphosphatase [Celerinatantimonas sp. YJH-8]|uniref:undecaprenyl-diphosphatase n=1 Tax=Celerinatantimonas sp. YJH-8 TaxID=3228714 RepID=UPI0038C6A2B9
MDALNQWLFLLINASHQPDKIGLMAIQTLAELPLFIIPFTLMILWFKGERSQNVALSAGINAVLALSMSFLISLIWYHNRPFADHIGLTLLSHVSDSSFPSDHVTLMASVGFYIFFEKTYKKLGGLLLVLSLVTGWARVFSGVHYPFDIFGAYILTLPLTFLFYNYISQFLQPLIVWAIRINQKIMGLLLKNQRSTMPR